MSGLIEVAGLDRFDLAVRVRRIRCWATRSIVRRTVASLTCDVGDRLGPPDADSDDRRAGALPPGTGGAIMNCIAERAERRRPALRYAGPYPTPALYRTLLRSFRRPPTKGRSRAMSSSARARSRATPIAVDFAPAPHRRGRARATASARCATASSARRSTASRTSAMARLHGSSDDIAAEVWFGDALWARVATLRRRRRLLDGPHPIPAAHDAT